MIILQAFVINLRFLSICHQLSSMKSILHVHITDLSPGMTMGNIDTTGLRWLSSFFNTPAEEKDNCDEHQPLILKSKCMSTYSCLVNLILIMNG